jgi:hypothetical protein
LIGHQRRPEPEVGRRQAGEIRRRGVGDGPVGLRRRARVRRHTIGLHAKSRVEPDACGLDLMTAASQSAHQTQIEVEMVPHQIKQTGVEQADPHCPSPPLTGTQCEFRTIA